MPKSFGRTLLSATACCALSALTLPVEAAPDHSTIKDQVWIVEKAGGPTTLSPDAARAMLNTIPGGVSLVTSEDFADRYAVSFQDMLATVPGVYARQRYAEEVRLSVRGSGVSRSFHLRGLRLLLDGVPLNAADGGGDFQEIDPMLIRHIEVYKGGNGLRYGAASLGGAINVVAPTARTVDYNVRLRLEGGSFDTLRAHGAYAWRGDTSDAYVAATGVTSDGYRQQSDQSTLRLNGNTGFAVGDGGETRFYVWANRIDQEVPGAISFFDALNNPKTTQAINQINDYARDIRSLRVANRTALPVGDGMVEMGVYGTVKSLYHPIFQVIDQDSVEAGAFARWTGELGVADVTFGANLIWGKVDSKRFVNVGGERGALTYDADQNSLNLEAYGEARLHLSDAMVAIVGGQGIYARRRSADNLDPVMSDRESYSSFSPKVGVIWDAAHDIQIYANASRSYEPPTFTELVQMPVLGFVPLEAQRAWTAEVGSRGHHGALRWDVSAYWSWVDGEMLQFTTNPTIPAATFNADDTVHRGIEAGLDVAVAEGVTLRAAYTFSDFRFRHDAEFGNNRIAGVPRHVANVEVSYRHPSGFSITPNLMWAMSRAYVDYANTATIPRYAVLGVTAAWEHEDGWRLFVDGRNLTGKNYIADLGTVVNAATAPSLNVFYPGDGRAVFAGVTKEF
jgi:iron complex outermembrane receptor protein